MVVSLAANERGTGFICGHDDGSIIRYYISEESGAQVSGRIIQHQTTPVALAWANGYIIAAGCDRRILFYDSQVREKSLDLEYFFFFWWAIFIRLVHLNISNFWIIFFLNLNSAFIEIFAM